MKTPNTKENIEYFIKELEAPVRELTDWEENFIESISDQFTRRSYLSDKQFEILERIYAEKTA